MAVIISLLEKIVENLIDLFCKLPAIKKLLFVCSLLLDVIYVIEQEINQC